jgi:hypothetical protein
VVLVQGRDTLAPLLSRRMERRADLGVYLYDLLVRGLGCRCASILSRD